MSDPTTGGDICYAGHESCACTPEGLCLMGLECLSNVCVVLPEGSTSGTSEPAESSGTTMALDDSTSSTSSSSEDSGESSSSDESGTTVIPPECEGEVVQCLAGGDTLQTCVDGSWVDTSCPESCTADGWTTGVCNPETQLDCACDGYADAECEAGIIAYCICYEYYVGVACTPADLDSFYLACLDGTNPEYACFGPYFDGVSINCETAVDACL